MTDVLNKPSGSGKTRNPPIITQPSGKLQAPATMGTAQTFPIQYPAGTLPPGLTVLMDDQKTDDAFLDSSVRAKFVRKMYMILSLQLWCTTMVNVPFLIVDEVQEFVYDYPWVVFIFLAVFVTPYFMLVCCESTRRNFPTNCILLFIMTLGMAGVVSFVTAKINTELIFYATLLTLLVTMSITTLSVFCPFDFTSCQMVMCVTFIILIVFSMIASIVIIFTHSSIITLVYGCVCVTLFSLFVLFDTQAITGGRRVQVKPEEYILGVIQIYVDLIEIFLNFMELYGACIEND